MQKENNLTVGQWCDRWFTSNRHKWNGNTEGGYRNLIYSHILPSIGNVALSDLTKQTITGFYNDLRNQGLGARSVWCVHLLLRRCMDKAAQDQLIPYNPVRLCQGSKAEEYKAAPLRLGHYSAGFTLDTYTHITNDMQRGAAEKIGGFMETVTATTTPEPPDPPEESRCKVIPFERVW